MKVVADTGPIVAAANRRDEAHDLAAAVVSELGRNLVLPSPIVVEADQLLRARVGPDQARAFLGSLAEGEHEVAYLSPSVLRRAVEFDRTYADLDLGFVDASTMALAERENLPILTFDFADFRATRPRRGFWRLVVDEKRYRESTR